jgi:polysaccharide pyruvyl transferase WcaK-like protein
MRIAHIHVWDKQNKGDVGIVEAVQELLQGSLSNLQILDVPMDQLKLAESEWLDKINSCDAVVIGGGGIYYRYFLPYNEKFIRSIKPPIATFGVGYINEFGSPPLTQAEKQSVATLNHVAKLRSVRDENTHDFLREIGINEEIHVIGDPAVLLSEKPTQINLGEFNVGFNINYSGWLGFGKYQDQILASYRECIDYLVSQHNANIHYLVHHPGEYDIFPKLDRELNVVDVPAKQQKYVYSKLQLVVGMMLHVGVMAFGAGTPIMIVAYDIRNLGFAKFIGFEEIVTLPQDLTPGLLKNSMEKTIKNLDKYREGFKSKIADIRTRHEQYLNLIKSL